MSYYKLSHFYTAVNKDPHPAANPGYYLLVAKNRQQQVTHYMFTSHELMQAHDRANKNAEDIPPDAHNPYEPSIVRTFLCGTATGLFLASFVVWFYVCRMVIC
jgi:hypothetical protein